MKFRRVVAILLLPLMLSGCGSLAGRHNIDSGFAYIESHEYQSALESFEAAEEAGEDSCLTHRGKGDMGIQYRRGGHWNISDDLADRDFVRLRTHVSYSLKGEKKVRTYMTWTMNGLRYLNSKLGYPNF